MKPMYLAPLTEFARDIGCKRMSFYAEHKSLKVLAATRDKSALLNASVPANVIEPGGFALEEHKLTMLMSPSGAKAELLYSEDGIVHLDYSGRHSSEEAAPFSNKRHAAKRLPVEYDAQALVAVERVVDVLWEHDDHERVAVKAADGRIFINGLSVGEAEGEAVGTYNWHVMAAMMHYLQDLERMAIRLQDGGPLVLTFLGPPDVTLCIEHSWTMIG